MAASAPLIERTDIHKSCKSLESVVNLFNDYCQVSDSLAIIQRKLAKALKEASSLKATNHIAGNSLNVAASLIEALADVHAKFVKVADKECEATSSDLKKWFKKLAKEEKNHDEKINAANAKIKQAGQAYEKKAKRKDADAAEEHTRYVNILNVVGPEMSQEKYNHAFLVSQRHTLALYGVIASISRTADAEWYRACECVRRFSPIIGRLGECRAYLEGQWMDNIPTDTYPEGNDNNQNLIGPVKQVDELGVRLPKESLISPSSDVSTHRSTPLFTPTTSYSSTPPSSATSLRPPQFSSSAPPTTSNRTGPPLAPPTSYFQAQADKSNVDSVRSIESLSNFPTPPTHFPLPYITQYPSSPLAQNYSSEQAASNSEKSVVEQKRPDNRTTPDGSGTAPVQSPTLNTESGGSLVAPLGRSTPTLTDDSGNSPLIEQKDPQTPLPLGVVGTEKSGNVDTSKGNAAKTGNILNDISSSGDHQEEGISRAGDGTKQERKVSRTESITSTSSIVASMRDKWGRGEIQSTTTTKERDVPRLTTKVADLATRYSLIDKAVPISPRSTDEASPLLDRPRQFSGQSRENSNDTGNNSSLSSSTNTQNTSSTSNTNSSVAQSDGDFSGATASEINIARRKKRVEELEDLERREAAQALKARERDLEMRTRELEMERERLKTFAVGSNSSGGTPLQTNNTRANATSNTVTSVRGRAQHSYSMTNLVQPHERFSGDGLILTRPITQYGEPLSASPMTMSPSNTSSNASTNQAQPRQQTKDKDKGKGWIKRLSMPVSAVGNAFSSSDSKKAGIVASGPGSPYGAGAGIGNDFDPFTKHYPFERDSTGGISNIAPRPRKLSFGRR